MANKIKYRMKVIKILMPYAEGVRRYFGLLMLLNLFIMGIQFIAPIIYKIFINDVIIGKQQERMYAVIMD